MPTFELIGRLISGFALLLANGVFVAVEFALTRLRQFEYEELGDSWGINLAWDMTEELEIYLTACQLGITVTSILLGVTFEPGVTELIHPMTETIGLGETNTAFLSVAVSVVIIQLMHTVWGEQSPTYLGVEKPREVAAVLGPVLYGWAWLIAPLIYVGDHMAKWTLAVFGIRLSRSWTEEEKIEGTAEMRRQIGELLSRGELSDERREEVMNALEIEEMATDEIMVDREKIKFIDIERSVSENIELMADERLSRFPLVEGSLDNFRGTIYVPGILPRLDELREGTIQWDDVAVETMTVDSDLPVSQLVDEFQKEQQELALVLRDDWVVGLVTSTDAFEAIIGEIQDPYD